MSFIDRRTFLQSTAGVCAVTLANTCRPVEAIGPIARNGEAKFKFSLAAYSYRELLTGKKGAAPELTLMDFVNDCARFGCDGAELTSYYFPKVVPPEYLHQLAKHCFRLGLDVTGTAVGNDFGHPPGDERLQQIAKMKQWIDYAAILGAPVIRIFAGHAKKDIPAPQTHSLMVAAIEECCAYAGEKGVHLALENHGGPTSDAAGLLQFVRDVKSPWFGVNLDTGNFHSDDIYGEIEQVAPYALNVQVKVVTIGPDKVKKSADFARLAKILRGVGYRGYIVLEYEEAGDPREECPKFLREIKTAFT
jgi:sugar phosphate isomerase/epimerase